MRTKRRTKRRNKIYSKAHLKGGEAIAAGGYGCVFKPPIHCHPAPPGISTSRLPPYDATGISKLMLQKHATDEMIEINKVKPFIDKIPNSTRYFLINGITSCKPDLLTSQDKKGFDNKCNNLINRGINTSNVNNFSTLNSLGLINIPYGGIDLDKYWAQWWSMGHNKVKASFVATNNALIRLLIYGIVPLNKQHFLHMDIKAGNILRSDEPTSTNIFCRLIDWGLASSYSPTGPIPEAIEDKVIQFNIPWSVILFETNLQTYIKAELLKTYNDNNENILKAGDKDILRVLAYNILIHSIQHIGPGHSLYIIEHILQSVFKPLIITETVPIEGFYNSKITLHTLFGTNMIIDYITEILFKYVIRGSKGQMVDVDIVKYFHEVFVHNVDIWGFIMAYLPIVEFAARTSGTPWEHLISRPLVGIILKYCFSSEYAATKIPIDDLIKDLLSLNVLVGYTASLEEFKPQAVAKKTKKKLILVNKSPKKTQKQRKHSSHNEGKALVAAGVPFSWSGPGKKRCPKGSRRNSNGKCIPK